MAEAQGNFKCLVSNCGMVFESKENLMYHQKHHGASISHGNVHNSIGIMQNQFVASSRSKYIEDLSLLHEVHLNPFDLEFRKASQKKNSAHNLLTVQETNQDSNKSSLDTPRILPLVDSDETISSTSRDDANLLSTSPILGKSSSVSSPTSSGASITSSQSSMTRRRLSESEKKEGRKKLTLIVSTSTDIQSNSGSIISTPTPVITAGPSVSQSLGINSSSLLNTPNILTANIPHITLNGVHLSDLNTPGLSPTLRFISGSPPLDNLSGYSAESTGLDDGRLTSLSLQIDSTKQGSLVSSASAFTNEEKFETPPSTATVLQLLLRLPDGQSIPVEIPATPLTSSVPSSATRNPVAISAVPSTNSAASAVVASVASTRPPNVASSVAGNATSSLAKMKLKQALASSSTAARPGTVKHSRATTADRIAEMTRRPSKEGVLTSKLGDEMGDDYDSVTHSEERKSRSGTTGGQKVNRKRRMSTSSPDQDPEEKRRKFLERNRVAAVRCREKKKRLVEMMRTKSDNLVSISQKLQSEVASLKAEVATLKSLLLKHKDCPVTLALQEEQREKGLPVDFNFSENESQTLLVHETSLPSNLVAYCSVPQSTPISVSLSTASNLSIPIPMTTTSNVLLPIPIVPVTSGSSMQVHIPLKPMSTNSSMSIAIPMSTCSSMPLPVPIAPMHTSACVPVPVVSSSINPSLSPQYRKRSQSLSSLNSNTSSKVARILPGPTNSMFVASGDNLPHPFLYSIPAVNSFSSYTSNNTSSASKLFFQMSDSASLPSVNAASRSSNVGSRIDRTAALSDSRTLSAPGSTVTLPSNSVLLNKIVLQSGCLSSKTSLPVLQHLPVPRTLAEESIKSGQSFVLCATMAAPSVDSEAE